MGQVYINEVGDHVGQEVTVKGWLYNHRSSGRIRFLLVRDGSGIIQATVVKNEVPEEVFVGSDHISQESSLMSMAWYGKTREHRGDTNSPCATSPWCRKRRTTRLRPKSMEPDFSCNTVICGCVRHANARVCWCAPK